MLFLIVSSEIVKAVQITFKWADFLQPQKLFKKNRSALSFLILSICVKFKFPRYSDTYKQGKFY